jgi:protein SCO1/2
LIVCPPPRDERIFAVAAVGGVAAGFLAVLFTGQFTGTDQFGRPFTFSSVKGKVVPIYFGYTHYPDVCPLVLSAFRQVMEGLGLDAGRVVFIFITRRGVRQRS